MSSLSALPFPYFSMLLRRVVITWQGSAALNTALPATIWFAPDTSNDQMLRTQHNVAMTAISCNNSRVSVVYLLWQRRRSFQSIILHPLRYQVLDSADEGSILSPSFCQHTATTTATTATCIHPFDAEGQQHRNLSIVYLKTATYSGINFWPPNPGSTVMTSTTSSKCMY